MRLLVEEHHLLGQPAQVVRLAAQLGHAREVGELAGQLLDLVHLGDDGGGALVEDVAVLADAVQEALAQPLGRELDGGERVLDLVGDAPGHLLPGGEPLRLLQVGEVVEEDDETDGPAALVDHAGDVHLQAEGLAAADGHPQVALDGRAAGGVQFGEETLDDHGVLAGQDLVVLAAEEGGRLDGEQLFGEAVDGGDAVVLVQGDDAGGHVLEDGLQVAAALLRDLGTLLQGLVSAGQLPVGDEQVRGHGVERVDQEPHLVARFLFQGEVQVPLGDPAGGLGQLVDRPGEAARDEEGEPDRPEQDEQGDDQEHDDQAELDRRLEHDQLVVAGHAGEHRLQGLEPGCGHQLGGDQEPGLRSRGDLHVHRHDGLDEFADGGPLGDHLGAVVHLGETDGLAGDHRQHDRQQPLAAHGDEFTAVAVEQHQAVRAAGQVDLQAAGQHPFQGGQVLDVQGAALHEHDQLPAGELGLLAGLLQGGLGQPVGRLQGLVDIGVEPVVHGGGDEAQGDDEEDAGGHQAQADKGDDQAGAQARAHDLLVAFEDQLHQVAQHQVDHEQQQQPVDVDQGEDEDGAAHRQVEIRAEETALQVGEGRDEQQAEGDHHADESLLALFLFRGEHGAARWVGGQ